MKYHETAPTRLARYRTRAAEHNTKHGKGRPGRTVTWRDCRQWETRTARPNNTRGPKGQIYSDSVTQYGDSVSAPRSYGGRSVFDITGYYADHLQSNVIRPHVVRLRGARGTLYIPVTDCTGWEGSVHYVQEAESVPRGSDQDAHDQAIRDAWHTAHRIAERVADAEQEHDAREQAQQDIEDARDAIQTARQQVRDLCRQSRPWRRHLGRQQSLPDIPDPLQPPVGGNGTDGADLGALCDAIRETVRRRLDEIAQARRVIAARTGDFWTSVQDS